MLGKLRDFFRRRPLMVPLTEEPLPRQIGPIKRGRPIYKRSPPALPGNYRIIDIETRETAYYGTTNDLKRRPGEHRRSGLYDPDRHIYMWQPANEGTTSAARYAHEKKKIKQLKPRSNRRNGGGGPR